MGHGAREGPGEIIAGGDKIIRIWKMVRWRNRKFEESWGIVAIITINIATACLNTYSLYPPNHPLKQILLFPFYRWGNYTQNVSSFYKVAQLANDVNEIHTLRADSQRAYSASHWSI